LGVFLVNGRVAAAALLLVVGLATGTLGIVLLGGCLTLMISCQLVSWLSHAFLILSVVGFAGAVLLAFLDLIFIFLAWRRRAPDRH
jgi:hypothetical protein